MKKTVAQLMDYDNHYRARFGPLLCGVDEVGRGPLAGPVVAAAVVLPPDLDPALLEGLADSKKLTEAKRRDLAPRIRELALGVGLGQADWQEIDRINILQATLLAMKRAVEQLALTPDLVMVDGNRLPALHLPMRDLIKGDDNSAVISAASVVAKVERDALMERLALQYPGYALEQHKGYPTKLHYQRLDAQGPSPIHRQTFLKKWAAGGVKQATPAQELGAFGEAMAAAHLERQGFAIVARNLHLGGGELDLVVVRDDLTVCVEVKTRTSVTAAFGRPADSIDLRKRRNVAAAVQAYVEQCRPTSQVRVDIIEVLCRRSGGTLHLDSINQIENPIWVLP